jgi:hypothetical protein
MVGEYDQMDGRGLGSMERIGSWSAAVVDNVGSSKRPWTQGVKDIIKKDKDSMNKPNIHSTGGIEKHEWLRGEWTA